MDEVYRWYQALGLFVAPQPWDGFGLMPFGARACGVSVLATNVGAFEELIVVGETGLIVPRDDLAVTTNTLKDMLSKRWSHVGRPRGRMFAQISRWSGKRTN